MNHYISDLSSVKVGGEHDFNLKKNEPLVPKKKLKKSY